MPSKSEILLENYIESNRNFDESTKIKEENFDTEDKTWDYEGSYEDNSDGEKDCDDEENQMTNLPLEVITTVEPSNFPYPTLKNMSNGVLTHRNIFTEQEREVLRNIVEKYRSIVDTRRRTRETYLEKQTVWQHIVEEFNGSENVMMRTEKELKKCWDNMKYRARLAEKEQQRAENFSNIIKSSQDPNLNNSTVHNAIEKMLSMQTQSSSADEGFDSLQHHDEDQKSSEDGYHADSRDESDQDDEMNDDEQPVLKKARQESPKLSSILLGEAKKSDKNEVSHYNIPNCTKVTHFKKKFRKQSSNPVSILPKGLNSCVSIMNIPNPNQIQGNGETITNGSEFSSFGAINLGGGVTIAPQKMSSLSANDGSNVSHVKPMPNLRKMLSPKNNISKASKSFCNGSISEQLQNTSTSNEAIEEKILLRRLDFDEQEHKIKMKILEKQLLAYTNEAYYWEIKLKLLKNGNEGSFGKVTNGNMYEKNL